MSSSRKRRVFGFVGVTVLLTIIGCGRKEVELGAVTGRVTLDGQPVRGVFIIFQPSGRRPALALLDTDGKFKLQYNTRYAGTVVGQQGVYLKQPLPDQMDEVRKSGIEEPTRFPKKFEQVFETVEVKSGRNHFNLELKGS